ncbi:hypothetical protein [Massilia agri]|uniref:Uncharacterized protein n=1 Tax=Massilia agri TaxID=1886785 RepID=A0ABT2AHZ9_9BURK|nr:hypothetical protein [Massilia agri]MCS0595874.1 hypothetical protein [Massilia agri]
MKSIQPIVFSILASLSLPSFSVDSPPKKTVTVRIPEISPSVPKSCLSLAETAYDAYAKEWSTNLVTPLNINQDSFEKEESSNRAEIDKGSRPANSHLIPVGTVPVFLDYADLTGTMTSLFIECNKRLAFVSKRGGIIDTTRWFGPFSF